MSHSISVLLSHFVWFICIIFLWPECCLLLPRKSRKHYSFIVQFITPVRLIIVTLFNMLISKTCYGLKIMAVSRPEFSYDSSGIMGCLHYIVQGGTFCVSLVLGKTVKLIFKKWVKWFRRLKWCATIFGKSLPFSSIILWWRCLQQFMNFLPVSPITFRLLS